MKESLTSGSKTIAKNTLFLYVRMFFTMAVSLYTSKVVLVTLGVEDYGSYSIIGGVVALFSFFNAAMSSSTQRFLSFDIGSKNDKQLQNTFNATLIIHIGIALLILILSETIGLWFVNNKLNVPANRMDAVQWVYQFSVLSFLIGVVQVPFNALIIAKERMNIYALMSIAEVILKLLIVYILVVFDFDKLKLYSVLIFAVTLSIALFYRFYCYKHFKETKFKWYYNKEYFNTLISFSGWSLFGNIAAIARGQGSNILLNMFFGTLLNASYAIALQVQGATSIFVTNFQMAINPQIIKNYAAGNKKHSIDLIFQSARLSYFLMFFIVCPVIFNVDFILTLWLNNPPDYTAAFTILALVNILVDCLSGPLMIGAQATGKIKWYQIVLGTLIFLCLPISYFLLKEINDPRIVYFVMIGINFLSLVIRVFFLKYMMDLNITLFLKKVFFNVLLISSVSLLIIWLVLNNLLIDNGFINFIVRVSLITLVNLLTIYFLGLNQSERTFIHSFIKRKIYAGKTN